MVAMMVGLSAAYWGAQTAVRKVAARDVQMALNSAVSSVETTILMP